MPDATSGGVNPQITDAIVQSIVKVLVKRRRWPLEAFTRRWAIRLTWRRPMLFMPSNRRTSPIRRPALWGCRNF